ncbi:hypothetical protein ABT052_28860 [Streptomyces sp. NPDC002766]
MDNERLRLVVALLGTALAALAAQAHPELIPALTLALAVWVVLATFLML